MKIEHLFTLGAILLGGCSSSSGSSSGSSAPCGPHYCDSQTAPCMCEDNGPGSTGICSVFLDAGPSTCSYTVPGDAGSSVCAPGVVDSCSPDSAVTCTCQQGVCTFLLDSGVSNCTYDAG